MVFLPLKFFAGQANQNANTPEGGTEGTNNEQKFLDILKVR